MNECDFERAENKHFTEAERLKEEANGVERNMNMIQHRVNALREQLRKDDYKPNCNSIQNINEMKGNDR